MKRTRREAGLTMTEVMLAVSVLAISFISLGGAVMTGVKGTVDMGKRNVERNQALKYMERVNKLSFGDFTDTNASADELNDLFDDQVELPELTLCQVATPEDEDGRQFRIAGFETPGTWEVRINRDADGNGVLDGNETMNDLLRIDILFDGKPILTTYRSKPTQSQ